MPGQGQKVKIWVYWDDDENAPSAATTVVNRKKGEAKIEWTPDETVKEITAINGLDPTQFKDVKKAGKKWKATDVCTELGKFPYVIVGTKADGTSGGADPTIRNEDE
jgi:hypothetical protein